MDFAARMKLVPNEELLEIVSSDSFVPEAVDAAKAEIERRNISPDEVTRVQVQLEERHAADEDRPNIPLSTAGKLVFLIFGPFLWTILAALVLRYRGYKRKSFQAFMCILASFPLYAAMSVMIGLLV